MDSSFRGQLTSLADEYERVVHLNTYLQEQSSQLQARLRASVSKVGLGQDVAVGVLQEENAHVPFKFVSTVPKRVPDGVSPLEDCLDQIDHMLDKDWRAIEEGLQKDEEHGEGSGSEISSIPSDVPADMPDNGINVSLDHLVIDVEPLQALSTSSQSTSQVSGAGSAHSPKSIAADNAQSINTMQTQLPIFPKWFDPGIDEDEGYETEALDAVLLAGPRDPEAETGNPEHMCQCSPLHPCGRFRLCWDLCAFLAVLLEFWWTPFELVYLGYLETPSAFIILKHSILVFFTIDIGLNFMTGFIEEDRTIIEHREIVRNYLRGWFWIDLVATFPCDLVLESVDGGYNSAARLGKASKVVKTVRYLKLLRAVRLVKLTQQANTFAQHLPFLDKVRFLATPVQGVLFLMLFAHVHGCLFEVAGGLDMSVNSFGEALRSYFENFWWAFCAVTAGASLGPNGRAANPWQWLLEMVISTERLLVIVFASKRVIIKSLTFLDDARKKEARNQVLKYLRQHRVSFQTQIQVLYSLKDTSEAKKHQMYTEEMLTNDLPQDLRRTICYELWGARLLSLGLIQKIATWHRDFVDELCMLVNEEVLPSRAVMFRVGDAANAAYHILKGELLVGFMVGMVQMPEFTKGMWVGESALASALLRRSATVITKSITAVMVVPGQEFHSLISRCGLLAEYQAFCSQHLWKGLCGRCGALGDHFSDTCHHGRKRSSIQSSCQPPSVRRFSGVAKSSEHTGQSMMTFGSEGSEDPFQFQDELPDMNMEMKRYITQHSLEFLVPILRELPEVVVNLDALSALDMLMLKSKVKQAGYDLTDDQENALSEASITQFRNASTTEVAQMLYRPVSRLQHLIFLSHYKFEAGTEAALMRTELERAIEQDPGNPGHCFDEPVFLDSDNLNNLEDLQKHVKAAHNLVVLLTKGVLSRPWVLVEIVTAMREGVRVLLVKVTKAGCEFEFPDDNFYTGLQNGTFLNEEDQDVIRRCEITLTEIIRALKDMFQKIAVPYSPHKATSIRQAEVVVLLKQCRLKELSRQGSPKNEHSVPQERSPRHSDSPGRQNSSNSFR